jgi:hypothetical protein
MITGGFRHGMFMHTREERFRQVIHHKLLCQRGLPWQRPLDGPKYWSSDPGQQFQNRRIIMVSG